MANRDTSINLPEQAAAAILRAIGLPPDEADALATRPLATPTLASDPLVARWLAAAFNKNADLSNMGSTNCC